MQHLKWIIFGPSKHCYLIVLWSRNQIRKQIHLAALSIRIHVINSLSSRINVVQTLRTLSQVQNRRVDSLLGTEPADINETGCITWALELYFVYLISIIFAWFAYYLHADPCVSSSCMVQLRWGKPTVCYSLHNQEATTAAGQVPPATGRVTIPERFPTRQLSSNQQLNSQ